MRPLHDELTLGVNIDHVATLREARKARYPDPVAAALVAERAGADQITVHLREDRRHIQDRDVALLGQMLRVPLNLEMAVNEEIVAIAEQLTPSQATFVPERRQEVTTEGGLDVIAHAATVKAATRRLRDAGVHVSHFIDPDEKQVRAALAAGAEAVELHTGAYAEAQGGSQKLEFERLAAAARLAAALGLHVACGHGLHENNVVPLTTIAEITEYNIGHALVASAVFDGLHAAVARMKSLLVRRAR